MRLDPDCQPCDRSVARPAPNFVIPAKRSASRDPPAAAVVKAGARRFVSPGSVPPVAVRSGMTAGERGQAN